MTPPKKTKKKSYEESSRVKQKNAAAKYKNTTKIPIETFRRLLNKYLKECATEDGRPKPYQCNPDAALLMQKWAEEQITNVMKYSSQMISEINGESKNKVKLTPDHLKFVRRVYIGK